MDGTTNVDSSNTYKKVFHFYATSAGSGANAAGTITLVNSGTTYLTMAAGAVESNGDAVYIQSENMAIMGDVSNLSMITMTSVTTANLSLRVHPVGTNYLSQMDVSDDWVINSYAPVAQVFGHYHSATKISFQDKYLGSANTLHAKILLWVWEK